MNSSIAAPSFVVAAATRQKRELALLALLIAEILLLTVTLDTEPLERIPSVWTTLVGWSPQYLRLAISIAVMTLLFGGRRFVVAVTRAKSESSAAQSLYLLVHAVTLAAFAWTSATFFAAGTSVAGHPGAWATVWCLTGALTIGSWALAIYPWIHWRTVFIEQRRILAWGIVAGTAVWGAGFLTEGAWTYFARLTFAFVSSMLSAIYPDVVAIPERLIVGTSAFRVKIAPECSGLEGVGLILAFLSIYLFLFRKDLRFPAALILLPIGAVTIWTLNAVRVVALIALGTSGWRDVALGGFHSQAGWLVFNVVGLTFVALINRGGYFTKHSDPIAPSTSTASDSTTAFVAPFVTLLAVAMLTGAFSGSLDWLYPLRIVAVLLVIWSCRDVYRNVQWRVSFGALGIGVVTFVLWMAMLPADLSDKDGWPAALQTIPSAWAGAWLAIRVLGYVAITPLVEELAFRGYVTRRLIQSDVDRVPVGAFSWMSFVLSSLLFGAFHGKLWLAGTMAGLAFAYALYRRRSLGDAVLAHGTTNGLIACYVFVTGRWSVWS